MIGRDPEPRSALLMDAPLRPSWDSPIVQEWIREGSVCPPIQLLKPEDDDD